VGRTRTSVVVGIIALSGAAALVAGLCAGAAAGSHSTQGRPSKEGHGGARDAAERRELKPESKFVTADGVVIAVRLEKQQLVLEHGEITGFMEAMTMGYRIDPPSLLAGLKPGDRIRFTIDVQRRTITGIEKLG
jgi:Cu/Ag efflux protein CusF